MRFRYWEWLAFSILLGAVGCRPAAPPDDPLAFFPDRRALRKGVVNKYYLHYASADGFERTADIRYYQYRLTANDRLRVTVYGPDARPRERSEYLFRNRRMQLVANEYYLGQDTLRSEISAGDFLNWAGDTAYFRAATRSDSVRGTTNEARQLATYDTTVLDRSARVFHREQINTYTFGEAREERIDTVPQTEVYVAGLGLYAGESQVPTGRVWLELAEQLPYERFTALAGKVPEPVGHIDPRKTLDRGEAFELCASATTGYPYYVGRAETHYRGGKRALRDTITARIDPTLLGPASGYLTFRFLINCRGTVGRFTLDQADLDFAPQAFAEATVRHLYELVRSLPGWQPATPRNQPRDTYTYLTFKLQDGALIDLLP